MKNPCILIIMLFVCSNIHSLKAQYSVDVVSNSIYCSGKFNTSVDDFSSADTSVFNIKKRIRNNELSIINFADLRGDVLFDDLGSRTILSYPTHGLFTIDDNGTPLDPRDDFASYSPDTDYVGMDGFSFEISDPDGGCIKINISLLIESDTPNMPMAFSPNGDGINDHFIISNLSLFPNNSIQVYNRWGNKVFNASPYMNDWKGKDPSGQSIDGELPTGTYFYIFDPGNGSQTIKGTVYLNR